jgi:hypothetical protein
MRGTSSTSSTSPRYLGPPGIWEKKRENRESVAGLGFSILDVSDPKIEDGHQSDGLDSISWKSGGAGELL